VHQIKRLAKVAFVLIFLGSASIYAASKKTTVVKIPEEIKKYLEANHPKAQILTATKCSIGVEKIESYGVLINANKPHAFIFFKAKMGWNDVEIEDKASNSKGVSSLFGDFFVEGKFNGPYEIRCTSPQSDKEISLDANGEYVGVFNKNMPADIKHLCFQASDTYNNWKCLTINPTKGGPDTSFVQLNAD